MGDQLQHVVVLVVDAKWPPETSSSAACSESCEEGRKGAKAQAEPWRVERLEKMGCTCGFPRVWFCMELEIHSQPRCLQRNALQLEEVLQCSMALVTGPCFSVGVSACFCDPRHHCPRLSVEKDLAVLNLTFCPSLPCGEKLDVFAPEG